MAPNRTERVDVELALTKSLICSPALCIPKYRFCLSFLVVQCVIIGALFSPVDNLFGSVIVYVQFGVKLTRYLSNKCLSTIYWTFFFSLSLHLTFYSWILNLRQRSLQLHATVLSRPFINSILELYVPLLLCMQLSYLDIFNQLICKICIELYVQLICIELYVQLLLSYWYFPL